MLLCAGIHSLIMALRDIMLPSGQVARALTRSSLPRAAPIASVCVGSQRAARSAAADTTKPLSHDHVRPSPWAPLTRSRCARWPCGGKTHSTLKH